MNPIVVIPARMAATRLPGKPLADIGGLPMIVQCWNRAREAEVGPVIVAAGDPEIVRAIQSHGGEAILTDPGLASGSDRVLAAMRARDPAGAFDTVVNLQGDMPFVDAGTITAAVEMLRNPAFDVSTVVAPEASPSDRSNPDTVKAVVAWDASGATGRALYFTRSTLYGDQPVDRHIGIYVYRRSALEAFTASPPSPLEQLEKLEQLRGLEMGLAYGVVRVQVAPLSVDSPADLEAARAFAQARGKEQGT